MAYILHNLIALDQFANTVLGGSPDETLSARAWRTEQDGKIFGRFFRPLIDTLLFWDKNHCRSAFESEQKKLQLPDAYRNTPAG